jgi:tetratricopeptide (TPR) repeat protein
MLEALERLCRGRRREPVVEVLRQRAPSWLSHVPSLSKLSSGRSGLASTSPERMLREMADAIVALGSAQPVVLLFEDLHWADPSTLQLLSYLSRRSDPMSVLIIGTYRPRHAVQREAPFADSLNEVLSGPNVEDLALTGLSEGELAQYLDMRFPRHEFPEALVTLLERRTSGNPLFVTRMVDYLLERGCLLQRGDAWHLDAPLAELERMIPDTLARTLQRELDRLQPFQRRVLEAASVVGTEFSIPLVAAALDEDVGRLEELCADWARKGELIRPASATEWPDGTVALRFAFQHGLYRQLAYDGTTATRRAELHRRVAVRLEAANEGQAGAVATELAMHCERARDWRMALHYVVTAAEAAVGRSAYREAIDHLTHGLELLPRQPASPVCDLVELRLRVLQGATLAMTRGYADPEVDRAYIRARELCARLDDEPDLHLSVLLGIARFYQVKGDCRTAGELAQEARALEPGRPLTRRFEAQVCFGVTSFYSGHFPAAHAHLQGLLPGAENGHQLACPAVENGDEPEMRQLHGEDPGVLLRSQLSLTSWVLGSTEQAFAMSDAAIGAAARLGHAYSLVFALYHRCLLLQFDRRHPAVLQAVDGVLALCNEHGFTLFAAMASMLKGASLSALSEHRTGLQALEEGWRAFSATGAGIAGSYWRSARAEALARAGRADEASSLLEEAVQVAQVQGDRSWEPEMYRLQGELILQIGSRTGSSLERAERLFLKSIEIANACGALSLQVRTSVSLARLWRDRGQALEAHTRLQRSIEVFDAEWRGPDLDEARRLLCEIGGPEPVVHS